MEKGARQRHIMFEQSHRLLCSRLSWIDSECKTCGYIDRPRHATPSFESRQLAGSLPELKNHRTATRIYCAFMYCEYDIQRNQTEVGSNGLALPSLCYSISTMFSLAAHNSESSIVSRTESSSSSTTRTTII